MNRCSQPLRLKACLIATTILVISMGVVHAQQGGEMPPYAVGVIQLKSHPIPVMNELPGRIAATRVSDVRARVSGILQERVFEQGSLVKQGDILYKIDPRLFKVRVASAEASLQKAKAIRDFWRYSAKGFYTRGAMRLASCGSGAFCGERFVTISIPKSFSI